MDAQYFKIIDKNGSVTLVSGLAPLTPAMALKMAQGCEKIVGTPIIQELNEDEYRVEWEALRQRLANKP